MSGEEVTLTIDGTSVTAVAGRSLVDVAAEHGVYIPTLCYLRHHDVLGTCRVCSVRVDGMVTAGCAVAARDGLRVEVDAPDLVDLRRALVELLFSEGNHNCPSCEKSGRCQLQAVAYELGMAVSRFPYQYPHREADRQAQRVWLERDRCIFCQRCVDFVRAGGRDDGAKIFSITGRGPSARIDIDPELADAMSPQEIRRAVALCPVGAILEKGVGYDVPLDHRTYAVRGAKARAVGSEA